MDMFVFFNWRLRIDCSINSLARGLLCTSLNVYNLFCVVYSSYELISIIVIVGLSLSRWYGLEFCSSFNADSHVCHHGRALRQTIISFGIQLDMWLYLWFVPATYIWGHTWSHLLENGWYCLHLFWVWCRTKGFMIQVKSLHLILMVVWWIHL